MKGPEVAGCQQCFYGIGTAVTLHPITEPSDGIAALRYNASRPTRPSARRNCFDLSTGYLKTAIPIILSQKHSRPC